MQASITKPCRKIMSSIIRRYNWPFESSFFTLQYSTWSKWVEYRGQTCCFEYQIEFYPYCHEHFRFCFTKSTNPFMFVTLIEQLGIYSTY